MSSIIRGFVILAAILAAGESRKERQDDIETSSWQDCRIFFAPSKSGWGVFAAKDFRRHESIEIASMVVPLSANDPAIKHSVLDDYVYGWQRHPSLDHASTANFGYALFYNHHPEPNIEYYGIIGQDRKHQTTGFRAKRDIRQGEELFSTYGSVDGGLEWFRARGIEMLADPTGSRRLPPETLDHFKREFCPSSYGGMSRPHWVAFYSGREERYGISLEDLAPLDTGYGKVRTNRRVKAGDRIEIGPGLVLSKNLTDNSLLGALVILWTDLDEAQQGSLMILRETEQMKLQYQGLDTSWVRKDRFESYSDLAILPAGGQIGMVRRVGSKTDANCDLAILWSIGNMDSVTVTLELVATKDLEAGEVLLLNLPAAGKSGERSLLKYELDAIGQAYDNEIIDATIDITEL